MRYAVVNIKPERTGKFQVTFSNGKERETINVSSLAKDTWCLLSRTGEPVTFYSSIENLISDFEGDLNARKEN